MHQPFLLLPEGTPSLSTIPTPVLVLHHSIIHSVMQFSPPLPGKGRPRANKIRRPELLTGSSYQRPFTQSPTQTRQDTRQLTPR